VGWFFIKGPDRRVTLQRVGGHYPLTAHTCNCANQSIRWADPAANRNRSTDQFRPNRPISLNSNLAVGTADFLHTRINESPRGFDSLIFLSP
jgi:hypothetical protein